MRQLNSLVYPASRFFWVAALLAALLLPSPISTARAAPELDTNDEIVFLTNEGEIRVFDPLRTGGATEVQFRSGVDKGFFDFVLGDVNNDGDKEIIAIGNDAAKGFVIYDPVVTSGVNDGLINGIPWRKLYQLALPGAPSVVAAGNFDPAVNGDEILVGYASGSGSRLDVYKGNAVTHDGTNWVKHIADQTFSNIWRDAAVGDLIPGGAAEVILIDPPSGITRVYRPDSGFAGICEYNNSGARPYDVSIGQWTAGGAPEFGMVRTFDNDSGFTQARFNVFGCDANTGRFDVDYGNVNHRFRDPFTVVAADVNNSGEDEFFMLRNLPSGSGGHLLGRNRATDINGFEVTLDADNGYQSIAAGDVDGDGKKEVIIMRNNNIRVFTDPEKSSGGVGLVNNYALATNLYSLESGDVDKNGFQVKVEYSLISDVPSFNVSVGAGDKKANAGLFTVKLNVDNVSKQHLNPPALEGFPAGLAVNFEVIGSDDPNFTPTSYLFHVDATNVTEPRPGNPYQGFFVFSSSDPEVPSPLRIPVVLEVTYARLEVVPASVGFVVFPCQSTPQASTQTVKVEGTAGVTFRTLRENLTASGVTAAAPWLSVSPSTGKVGDTLTLSFDPSKWTPRETTQTQVFVVGMDGKTDGQLRTLNVSLLCANFQMHLPIIGR